MFRLAVREDAWLSLAEERHAGLIFSVVDRNREHLGRWLPWVEHTRSEADTRAFVRQALQRYAKGRALHVLLWHSGQLAGGTGLRIDPENRAASIGYWLDAAQEGRGLVTDSVRALIRYAFDELALHRLEIRCEPRNTRSRAVPRRLGFQEEGTLRHVQRLNSGFSDLIVYSLLAGEPRL